ncbi:MAG: lytic murein transglycosylase [Vicinamibacterales bacterium]
MRLLLAIAATMVAGVLTASAQEIAPVAPLPPPFSEWLAALKTEALSRGIRQEIVDAALADVEEPVATVLERDRSQAEFTLQLDEYLRRRLTPRLTRTAQDLFTRQRTLLTAIGRKYGVSPRVLVAVWGLESNFGRFAGVRPTIPALATLAYDPRRATFFRAELFAALEILNNGDIDLPRLKGSWAGALGQPQFMPSSYLKYAQDYDGDGHRDIWSSPPDVFASVANYMREHGWSDGRSWGREVLVPKTARRLVTSVPTRDEGCRAERMMSVPRSVAEWRKKGVRGLGNTPLPAVATQASLVTAGSRFFLVYDNYEAILGYNCAHTYALSVALLSDRLK